MDRRSAAPVKNIEHKVTVSCPTFRWICTSVAKQTPLARIVYAEHEWLVTS